MLLAVALVAVVVATARWAPAARAASVSSAGAASSSTAVSTDAAASASAAPDAVVVAPRSYAGADPLIAALTHAGAPPAIVYLPRAALARVSAAEAVRLRALGYTVWRAHDAAPAGASGAGAALAALDAVTAGAAAAGGHAADIPADLPSLAADLKLSTTATAAATPTGQPAQGLVAPAILGSFATVQTATAPMAYAAGSVAVSIIFPQSTAAAPNHSENWEKPDPDKQYDQPDPAYPSLTARQGYIVAEVSKALLWWQAEAPTAAHLTFVIPAADEAGLRRRSRSRASPSPSPRATTRRGATRSWRSC